ncbi:hypothetical protein AX768_10405 [Burkholderia sp. PAMC 28687]|uniref:fimbrial protein n=1 Tax=Burkholderia sp. PAMC 28687 TaxID=1795874 RepID=UPI000784E62C|nr:fimbrial protein [Burkholderia sp. PAMC 28687]AMM14450.1 hypothetical protein AX768_10405 [Burkholderia sp. PAMC 28687]
MHPRNNICKVLASAACLLGLGAASLDADASCSFADPQTAHVYTITIPPQSLSRDVPVGTVLYKGEVPTIPVSGLYAWCAAPGTYLKLAPGSALISSTNNVFTYATNIDGIGIRFYEGSNGNRGSYYGPGITGNWVGSWNYSNSYYGVEIVRTQPTGVGPSSGTVAATAYATFTLDQLLVATIQFTPFEVGVQTCTVTTPSINVDMPRAHTRDLPTVNSTYGDTTFNMGLNCAAGIKVAMTITDASQPNNTSTTLSLGHDSTASGVGYQIVNGGVPIAFGQDSAVTGTANQFVIVPLSVSGAYSIPLVGRYVRTGTMVPGSAKAYATFTMSYQ